MRRPLFATVAAFAALQVMVPGSAFQISVQVPRSVRALVSRADRVYKLPIARSEGIPIGNGRIGTVVWTTPSALKLQINRVGMQVDLELAGAGADVFRADGTHQRLSVYEGLLDVKAAGVSTRLLAWPERDVIAIDVEDRRPVPEPIQIKVRMPRMAKSEITARGGRILFSENVRKAAHRAKSAVALALLGRRTLTRVVDETEARIVSPAERGRVVILIATATTPAPDAAALALSNLDAAAAKSFDDLAGDTAEWWHHFWQRNAISLNIAEATVNKPVDDYHYRLYLMGATGVPVRQARGTQPSVPVR